MSPERNHFDNGIAGGDELDETDRMVALIEAATAKFDANEPAVVESIFTGQALALDVIFKEFIKRRSYTFDCMRVALRAQAQCRSTFKSLDEFKNPRRPASSRPARNSNEQTIENAKSSA